MGGFETEWRNTRAELSPRFDNVNIQVFPSSDDANDDVGGALGLNRRLFGQEQ